MAATQTRTVQARSAPSATGAPEVIALSPTEWRLRTTSSPESDGNAVLGVIQLIGDTYEAMQDGAPLARYYFASLEDAVEYLVGVR